MVPARNSYLTFVVMAVIHEPLKTDKSNFVCKYSADMAVLFACKIFHISSLQARLEKVQTKYDKFHK